MGNIKHQLNDLLDGLSGDDSAVKIQRRASQVNDEFKQAIELAYKEYAPLFLEHINAVYITARDNECILIAYLDESMFAADLNAQREMIKGWLNSTFNENIDAFEIHISRGSYRSQHPFALSSDDSHMYGLRELEETEKQRIDEICATVENETVRASLKNAMTADLKRH